ncbi:MAG: tetratricopeptide repeat protein [Woeseiaceae bacterium]|nr:tetratricopeptide repeat protein [Woeseiaceae bacterium]
MGVLALYIVGAWVVLQVAALAFPGWDIPDSAIRYVWMGTVLLFPIALAFGWRYEITARGIRRSAANADVPLATTDYWIIATLSLVAGVSLYAVIDQVLDTRVPAQETRVVVEAPENSIAVLPFVNMSDDEENDYFSDGMSEQLLNELARIPELHVAARTSAFYYKGRDEIVQKIGEELGVKTLLEGSVRKAGDKVRITAQLIDATNGYHLWSETYDRRLDDIFAVQDEIAGAIVSTLKIRMLAQDKLQNRDIGPRGAEAFDLFLRGLARQQSDDPEGYDQAISFYRQAVEIAPLFAAAHKEIAYTYLMMPFSDRMSFNEAIDAAEPYISRALELEPDSAEVIATLAQSRSLARNYEESNRYFQQALSLNPNYFTANMNYGISLIYQGRLKEASTAYIQAQALDPMNARLNANLGAMLMLMGQFEDGVKFSEKAMAIDPTDTAPRARMTSWLSNYGRLADAVRYGLDMLTESPANSITLRALTRAYVRLGMIDEAAATLDALMKTTADDYSKGWTSDHFYIATNDSDGYAEFAEKLFQNVEAAPGDPLTFTDRMRVQWYGRSLLLRDRDGEAADMFWWAAGGEDGIASTTYDYVFFLKYLALTYLRLDRREEAEDLLTRAHQLVITARDNGWSTPFLYVRLAEIEVLLGDHQSAVQNIGIAVDKGYRDLPWLSHSVFFRDIQEESELLRLMNVVRDAVAEQRVALESHVH